MMIWNNQQFLNQLFTKIKIMSKSTFLAITAMALLVACGQQNQPAKDNNASEQAVDNTELTYIPTCDMNEEFDGDGTEEPLVCVYSYATELLDTDTDTPRYRTAIKRNGEFIQYVEGKLDKMPKTLDFVGTAEEDDANFDGENDVIIFLGNYAYGPADQTYSVYDLWTYDKDSKSLKLVKEFRNITNQAIDKTKKHIIGTIEDDFGSLLFKQWKWNENGELFLEKEWDNGQG